MPKSTYSEKVAESKAALSPAFSLNLVRIKLASLRNLEWIKAAPLSNTVKWKLASSKKVALVKSACSEKVAESKAALPLALAREKSASLNLAPLKSISFAKYPRTLLVLRR
ncbi:MAG: hypothetical protein ACJ71G_06420 [Nitrososphaeraceae archaeon]